MTITIDEIYLIFIHLLLSTFLHSYIFCWSMEYGVFDFIFTVMFEIECMTGNFISRQVTGNAISCALVSCAERTAPWWYGRNIFDRLIKP